MAKDPNLKIPYFDPHHKIRQPLFAGFVVGLLVFLLLMVFFLLISLPLTLAGIAWKWDGLLPIAGELGALALVVSTGFFVHHNREVDRQR